MSDGSRSLMNNSIFASAGYDPYSPKSPLEQLLTLIINYIIEFGQLPEELVIPAYLFGKLKPELGLKDGRFHFWGIYITSQEDAV